MQALRKKKKEFMTSKHQRLTVRDILNKHTKLKREGWRIERLIRRKKLLIGLSKRTVNKIYKNPLCLYVRAFKCLLLHKMTCRICYETTGELASVCGCTGKTWLSEKKVRPTLILI